MRIRKAEPRDIEAIARLHAESWRSTYRGQYADSFLDGPVCDDRLAAWIERLGSPARNQHVIVAEGTHTLLGFGCAFADDDVRWGTLLDNLHVDTARKRSGIGTRLIREIGAWARDDAEAPGLYLWVLEANASARSFYERLGAMEVERRIFAPPGGGTAVTLRYAWGDVDELGVAADAAIARADSNV